MPIVDSIWKAETFEQKISENFEEAKICGAIDESSSVLSRSYGKIIETSRCVRCGHLYAKDKQFQFLGGNRLKKFCKKFKI